MPHTPATRSPGKVTLHSVTSPLARSANKSPALKAKVRQGREGLREVRRLSTIALSTVSGVALRNVLPEIHDLTWQTIMLKVGLRLGFVEAFQV